MESNRMKVSEAATLMGCSQETIRLGLIQGVFPWGYAVKTSDKFTYVIIRDKFMSDIQSDIRGNKREVIELVGAINSLRNLRKICIGIREAVRNVRWVTQRTYRIHLVRA